MSGFVKEFLSRKNTCIPSAAKEKMPHDGQSSNHLGAPPDCYIQGGRDTIRISEMASLVLCLQAL